MNLFRQLLLESKQWYIDTLIQGYLENIAARLSRIGLDVKKFSGYHAVMKTADTLSLTHERVDDIQLLLGFMQQLNFPTLLESHLGSHRLHRGLPNGWLATVWLAFLLSQSNHRKVSVQDWARQHAHT